MRQLQFREADCFTRQSFNPSSEIQIFAFNFLGVALTHLMLVAVKMTLISAPVIGVITANARARARLSAL